MTKSCFPPSPFGEYFVFFSAVIPTIWVIAKSTEDEQNEAFENGRCRTRHKSMPREGSQTHWIAALKQGNPIAAQRLWEEYFPKLVQFAGRRLKTRTRRVADEEDVALSALNSFYLGTQAGKFPDVNDRNDLWRLLLTITARKANRQAGKELSRKRGAGKVRSESVFLCAEESGREGINAWIDNRPSPAFAAEFAEEFRVLLDRLGDRTLQNLAVLKLQGYSNEEIAGKLGCSLSTVERRLRGIRAIWKKREQG
jgi:DNA-directed RNA polymerase specialized sigma24 family protein